MLLTAEKQYIPSASNGRIVCIYFFFFNSSENYKILQFITIVLPADPSASSKMYLLIPRIIRFGLLDIEKANLRYFFIPYALTLTS